MMGELSYHQVAPAPGRLDVDVPRLLTSMMLIQAGSGGGKSWAIRHLVESLFGVVPIVLIDPEGEFYTLREKYDFFLAAPKGGDVEASAKTAPVLARRFREMGASAILDIFELPPRERILFVRRYLETLMDMPRSQWTQFVLVLDEAQMFAPEKGEGDAESAAAVTDVSSRGRKRGICLVCATQRLARFSNNVAGNMHNKLIGLTTLDTDVARAGKTLGFGKDRLRELAKLAPGEFYALGPAIAREVITIKTGKVKTRHPEPGELNVAAPPPSKKVLALIARELADLPREAEEEARTLDDLKRKLRETETRLHTAQRTLQGAATLAQPDPQVIERAVRAARAPWEKYAKDMTALIGRLHGLAKMMAELTAEVPAAPFGLPPTVGAGITVKRAVFDMAHGQVRVPARVTHVTELRDNGTLTGARKKLARALAELEALGVEDVPKKQLAFYAGISLSGGYGSNTLGSMRTDGLVEYPQDGYVRLTEAGRAAAGSTVAPGDLAELHARVRSHLKGLELKIFDTLTENTAAPVMMSKDELGERIGASFAGGYGSNTLGALRTAGVVDYPRPGHVSASRLLYPESLV